MSRYTRRLTSVRFEDSAATGLVLTPSEGNLSIGEANAENAEHQPTYDRDQHDGFTLGRDLVQDCSITLEMANQALTSAAAARVLDFIHKRNFYSALVSLDPTIWCWKTIVTFDDGTISTTRTLAKCEGGESISEGQPANTIVVSFRNHVAVVDA